MSTHIGSCIYTFMDVCAVYMCRSVLMHTNTCTHTQCTVHICMHLPTGKTDNDQSFWGGELELRIISVLQECTFKIVTPGVHIPP
jgi:hypothetical protein